jgi:hypothetical protein
VRPAWIGAVLLLAAAGCQSDPLAATSRTPSDGIAGAPAEPAAGGNPSEAGQGNATEPSRTVLFDSVVISSNADAEHFQSATTDIDFGEASVASAKLFVELTSPCFPFSNWVEQGVPAGQRWPARCDAFDRGLSVSLDDAEPGVELVRAVTPFGGPLKLEVDVTDVVNGLPGQHRLRLSIDTWSDADGLVSGSNGEWQASVSLETTPGAAPRRVLAVIPLALESQTQVDATPVELVVPEGAGSARIDYLVTGHGGVPELSCVAEEFCQRTHELRLDGQLLEELSPWRSDCASLCTITPNDAGAGPSSYCAENPCGSPDSVRAPRANWCPGSLTPPVVIEKPALTVAGAHELTRSIHGLREGGQWRVSATYFAFE